MKINFSNGCNSKNLILVLLLLFLFSCNSKDSTPQPQSPEEKMKTLLTSSEWRMQSVTVDGVNQSEQYNGFKIRFAAYTFTTVNGKVVWPQAGTWKFDGDATTIQRNDGVVVQLAADVSSLTMTFTWDTSTLGSGKLASTSGVHIFSMVK